jgi:hypothetical protein
MQGVPGSRSGLASGLLNTSRLMGGALGLAILSTIAASTTHGEVALAGARALTDGFDQAFTVAAGFALAGSAVAAVALRRRASDQVADRAVPDAELVAISDRGDPDPEGVLAA